MNVAIQIPDHLQAEFEQRARERYGDAGLARALQEAIALLAGDSGGTRRPEG